VIAFVAKGPEPVETDLTLEFGLLFWWHCVNEPLMAIFFVFVDLLNGGLKVKNHTALGMRLEEPHRLSPTF
jgi:hypothetical protein